MNERAAEIDRRADFRGGIGRRSQMPTPVDVGDDPSWLQLGRSRSSFQCVLAAARLTMEVTAGIGSDTDNPASGSGWIV